MRQQHSYPVEAIVLKRTDLGEADRVLTLLTPNKGKFHAIAKGIRRPISKKAGHLELLSHSQLQVALGRNLDIITQAEVRENFLALRNDLWHMTCGLYLAELVDRFVEDDTKHPEVYALMLEMLRGIEEDVIDLQQRKEKGKELVGYEPKQILLLHANELEGDHFSELVEVIRKRGYRFITLEEALNDLIYSLPDMYVGEDGTGWLDHWAITRGKPPRGGPEFPAWVIERAKGIRKTP